MMALNARSITGVSHHTRLSHSPYCKISPSRGQREATRNFSAHALDSSDGTVRERLLEKVLIGPLSHMLIPQ